MDFSPEDHQKVIEHAARLIVAELRQTVDFAELITLPLDAIAPVIGVGPKQLSRILPTRQMGTRKLGVSLRAVLDYQNGTNTKKSAP